jgi:kynurenine formamidase
VDTTPDLDPVGACQLARRAVIAAGLAAAGAAVIPAPTALSAPIEHRTQHRHGHGHRRIPRGYGRVDPRTATRVPLTMSLRDGVPLYPGDPPFTWHIDTDTRVPQHDDGGYLLEQITSLGTHTASHISAPVHFIIGGQRLDQLSEDFTLMPLAVIDLRRRIQSQGPDFTLTAGDLRAWERRHGPIPANGCVLLLTGYAPLYYRGKGADSPYVTTNAPGFAGEAVDWLFDARSILATGSDTLGPDATIDETLRATTRTLLHGGITLESVGPGLPRMRPHGDWIAVNGNRPAFSGFQMGFTGFTLASHRSTDADKPA